VLREFIPAGQPVCIASMPMAGGTAPVTLAGAMALANAEILAGNVITQHLGPGTPVLYGGIPHILDRRTTLCSFCPPRQLNSELARAAIVNGGPAKSRGWLLFRKRPHPGSTAAGRHLGKHRRNSLLRACCRAESGEPPHQHTLTLGRALDAGIAAGPTAGLGRAAAVCGPPVN
jgi:hypothetical protein